MPTYITEHRETREAGPRLEAESFEDAEAKASEPFVVLGKLVQEIPAHCGSIAIN